MFTNSIYQESGNIPEDVSKEIKRVAASLYGVAIELAKSGTIDSRIVRLFRPSNIAIFLVKNHVHFVITVKNVGGSSRINLFDFHDTESLYLEGAISVVERDLGYEDCFGFSTPRSWLVQKEIPKDELLSVFQDYYEREQRYLERRERIVRINPIFRAREVEIDPALCFVLMPYSEKDAIQEIYSDQIRPTIEAEGYQCQRADNLYKTEPIIEIIWEGILRSRFVLAELTGRNPNVFYELGIAHTVGKEVILVTQNIDDIPFDLRHLRAIVYETTPRGAELLKKQLIGMLRGLRRG